MNYPHERPSVSLSSRIASELVPAELTALDQWRVQRHLGSGSSATVWLLEHTGTQHTVACKFPRAADDHPQLSQEAELAAGLAHENLIRPVRLEAHPELTSAQQAGATFWEYLPAGSLESLISAAGALSIAQTVTVMVPMIQATQYLHERQIVHGDLSPANILFDLTGRPVLLDLGTVRATAHAFHAAGTPGFVAPEILGSDPQMDGLGGAADVYSLGAIGWFCLTATSPGSAQSRMPLNTLRPGLDQEIAEVLEACLSAEPTLRPALSQVLTAVARWADPAPVDLYAAVDEDSALFLPTRKSFKQQRSRGRRSNRDRSRATRDAARSVPARDQGVTKATLRRRRLWLAASAGTLVVGVLATTLFVDQRQTVTPVTEEHAVAEDFQKVVDELAKARSQAWASADPDQVVGYAVEGSEVFSADVAVLADLRASNTTLDGIRMRAVVEDIESTDHRAALSVTWRTDGYVQRDASAEIISTSDTRTEHLVLHLVETSTGWALSSVEAI